MVVNGCFREYLTRLARIVLCSSLYLNHRPRTAVCKSRIAFAVADNIDKRTHLLTMKSSSITEQESWFLTKVRTSLALFSNT
jgi:hypothetical protein